MTEDVQVTEEEYQASAQRFTALIEEFEVLPYPEIRDKVFELLQAVDTVHRAGLERLALSLKASGHGELLERAAEDDIVHTLLALYDLAAGDDLTQAEAALEIVRPYMHSHGGEVEVLQVDDGIVHLRLSGACHGCAGSTMTLTRGIEAALREGFPGFRGIRVHESVPAPAASGFVPLGQLGEGNFIPLIPSGATPPPAPQRPIFSDVASLGDLQPGGTIAVDVEKVRVLIGNVGGEIYAVRNNCPGSMAPLDLGNFTPPVVVCPWHNEPYDIRTGLRVDGVKEPKLQVVPVAITDGTIQVAVNVLSGAG